jgi:hypothetical protein
MRAFKENIIIHLQAVLERFQPSKEISKIDRGFLVNVA